MASEGPNSPGTVVSDATVGTIVWGNPNEAKASDNIWAIAPGDGISEYLLCTNFGFSIPDGATIDGITVAVEKNSFDSQFGVTDEHVKIVKGGSIGTTNKADTGTEWPTTDGTATYGGVSDLWGETWTAADINASNFGIVVSSDSSAGIGGDQARIDHVTITVTYTEVAAPAPPEKKKGGGGMKFLIGKRKEEPKKTPEEIARERVEAEIRRKNELIRKEKKILRDKFGIEKDDLIQDRFGIVTKFKRRFV